MKQYLINLFIAIDQLVNAILGGYPDETISSRTYSLYLDGKLIGKILKVIIDTLFFFEKEHCKISYLAEFDRSQNRKQNLIK